ncbi:MAG: glycosyltransferase family 4 protein [Anaerolineales bacterium]|nr:glycosyltransferase family 4 protein [Anaerolineales bacterium]
MKIGLVNEYFPPFAPGGAEWSNLALAKALAKRHDVFVITPNYGAAASETVDGVHIRRFPSPIKLKAGQLTVPLRYLTGVGFGQRVGRAVRETAVSHQLDILHIQNKYSLPGAWWGSRGMDLPIVQSIRDTSMVCPTGQCLIEYDPTHSQCTQFSYWWRSCLPLYLQRYIRPQNRKRAQFSLLRQQLHLRWQRAILRRVDGVVGVSNGILTVYHNSGIKTGRRTAAIYNIPPEPTQFSAEKLTQIRKKHALSQAPLVLYVGKLSPGKGSQVLADAAKQVADSVTGNVQFVFIGQGDVQSPGPFVRLLGRLPHDDVQALYHLADMVVIPSSTPEAFSRVGLEAMAAAKPLIGTQVGGTPEQIENGRNGLLVPRKDPGALAQAIRTLLQNPALRMQMGAAGLERVKTTFSPAKSISALETFYQQLIQEKAGEYVTGQ